jgi:hypothetical protein
MKTLLGIPDEAQGQSQSQTPALMSTSDILLCFDGRKMFNSSQMRKVLTAKRNQLSSTSVRLFYHNREFGRGMVLKCSNPRALLPWKVE